MKVDLTPELQAKLDRAAAEQGRDSEALVVEAVERMFSYDEWFLQEVEKGIAAANRGELIDHKEVRKLIDGRYPGWCAFGGRGLRPKTSPQFAITLAKRAALR